MRNLYRLLPCGRAIIYLNGGGRERATLIDAADLPAVMAVEGRWYAQRRSWTWYAAVTLVVDGRKQTFRMHRFLTGCPDDLEVDHVDHDGLNNTRANLRNTEPIVNKHNRRRQGSGMDIGRRWYEQRAIIKKEVPSCNPISL